MKTFFKSLYQKIYYFYFLLSVCLVFIYSKGDIFLCINQHHQLYLDIFFKYITYLGDGAAFAIVFIAFLFYKNYYAVVTLFTSIVQSILVVIFKKGIFKGLERPLAFFEDTVELYLVDDVKVHSFNTFPSGHTATAFAVFGLLAFAFGQKRAFINILCVLLAISVAFSRIYLAQHFFIDTLAGSFFGIVSIYAGIAITERFFKPSKIAWIDQRLIKIG